MDMNSGHNIPVSTLDYKNVTELDLYLAPVYTLLGAVYCYTGKYHMARYYLDRAIELDPEFTFAYSNHAWVSIGLGEYRKAVIDSSRAIELDPGIADAYASRCIAYSELGNKSEAVADLKKYTFLSNDMTGLDQLSQKIRKLKNES